MFFRLMLMCAALVLANPAFAQNSLLEKLFDEAERYAEKHQHPMDAALAAWPPWEVGKIYPLQELGFSTEDCHVSDQFQTADWCSSNKVSKPWSKQTALVMRDGRLAYINREAEIAAASVKSLHKLVKRLPSGKNETLLDPGPNQTSFVFSWGSLTFDRLSGPSIEVVAKGESPSVGILMDHLNAMPLSAKNGYPVYSLQKGSGSVWIANMKSNRALRIRAFNYNAELANGTSSNDAARLEPQPTAAAVAEVRENSVQAASQANDNAQYVVADINSVMSSLSDKPEIAETVKRLLSGTKNYDRSPMSIVMENKSRMEREILNSCDAGRRRECFGRNEEDRAHLNQAYELAGNAVYSEQKAAQKIEEDRARAAAEEAKNKETQQAAELKASLDKLIAAGQQLRDKNDVVAQVLNYTSFAADDGLERSFWWKVPGSKCVYNKTPDNMSEAAAKITHGGRVFTDSSEVLDLDTIDPRTLRTAVGTMEQFSTVAVLADTTVLAAGLGDRDPDRIKRGWALIFSDYCKGRQKAF